MNTLAAAAIIAAASALPGAAQDVPDTIVSTVIIDGVLVEKGKVPASASGLVVDPVQETAAEQIRNDAITNLTRRAMPNILPVEQPQVTTVSVDSVAVSRPTGSKSEACVAVGQVGARERCRPPN